MNWDAASQTITVSSADYEIFTGTDCKNMFQGLGALTSIEGMEYVNTKNTQSMAQMFQGCTVLPHFPVENFDTRKVTTMANMFQNCNVVETIDLSSFSSESLTNVSWMFGHSWSSGNPRSALREVIFGENFKCKKVANFGDWFQATSITAMDLSFMEPQATHIDLEGMFSRSNLLESVDLSSFASVDTEIYNISRMFSYCSILAEIKLGTLTLSGVTIKSGMMNDSSNSLGSGKCDIYCTNAAWTVISDPSTNIVTTRYNHIVVTP